MERRCRVIGIGGVSRSGKSFFAKSLSKSIIDAGNTCQVLDQDDFVLPKEEIPVINGHIDWEIPASIDWQRFHEAVSAACLRNDYIIVEGLLVFWDPHLLTRIDYRIFIELSKTDFVQRKKLDLRWGLEPDWYIDYIWEAFQKHGQFPGTEEADLVLDGRNLQLPDQWLKRLD